MDTYEIFQEMAHTFQNKMEKEFSILVECEITDTEKVWHVKVENGEVTVKEGQGGESAFRLKTSSTTLQQIYDGEITALTAAGKAMVSDTAPLDWKLPEGIDFNPEYMSDVLFFIQHFFNRTDPEKIHLGEEHSRVVHGGHVVALYYHPGLRSAWYKVKKGEMLNEPGETNPFPQAFIFIEGEGTANIGGKEIPVKANESYYIPPDTEHTVWTESDSPLVFIWLAWGKGA